MEKLDFLELHNEKSELIFNRLSNFATVKEYDTIETKKNYKKICEDFDLDYDLRMSILNENIKFVVRHERKDNKVKRRIERKNRREQRRKWKYRRYFGDEELSEPEESPAEAAPAEAPAVVTETLPAVITPPPAAVAPIAPAPESSQPEIIITDTPEKPQGDVLIYEKKTIIKAKPSESAADEGEAAC